MNYKLNSEGLSNMPFDKYDKNFTFIVNNQEIKTNRIIADFLSPIIFRSHYNDISNDTYHINIKNQHEQSQDQEQSEHPTKTVQDYFRQFLHLINFQESTISSTECKYYCDFFYELGNIDEYFRLQPSYLSDLTVDNAIPRLKELTENKKEELLDLIRKSQVYVELINYISKNFASIDQNSMKSLSTIEIERIIHNESITIQNEDELFEFILSIYNDDQKKGVFVRFCHF